MFVPQRSLCWLLCKALLLMVISTEPSFSHAFSSLEDTDVLPLMKIVKWTVTLKWFGQSLLGEPGG